MTATVPAIVKNFCARDARIPGFRAARVVARSADSAPSQGGIEVEGAQLGRALGVTDVFEPRLRHPEEGGQADECEPGSRMSPSA
jgi:hypothetical protein